MILLNFDYRIGLFFLPLLVAGSWALFNIIYALKNNIPKSRRYIK